VPRGQAKASPVHIPLTDGKGRLFRAFPRKRGIRKAYEADMLSIRETTRRRSYRRRRGALVTKENSGEERGGTY